MFSIFLETGLHIIRLRAVRTKASTRPHIFWDKRLTHDAHTATLSVLNKHVLTFACWLTLTLKARQVAAHLHRKTRYFFKFTTHQDTTACLVLLLVSYYCTTVFSSPAVMILLCLRTTRWRLDNPRRRGVFSNKATTRVVWGCRRRECCSSTKS